MSSEYMSIDAAAKKWGISARRIRFLCIEGRIEGAVKSRNQWKIPVDTEKPEDQRVKTGKYVKTVRKLKRGKRYILIADDDELSRSILREIFKDYFVIFEACNGEEAIEQIEQHKEELSMVFVDLIMPKKTGIEVMQAMQKKGLMDKIPVILITGEATDETDQRAYELGASDIIYKPYSAKVVIQRTLNIIELFEHRFFLEKKLDARSNEIIRKNEEVSESNIALERQRKLLLEDEDFLIKLMGSLICGDDPSVAEHMQRVRRYTFLLIDRLNNEYPEDKMDEKTQLLVSNAAALHDIGMSGVPREIVYKPSKLTAAERGEVTKHTLNGYDMVSRSIGAETELTRYCSDICRWHHERVDGSGYPNGLVGDEIPIWVQLASIADVFASLICDRPYRPAYSVREAITMMDSGECGAFSPKMMRCFKLALVELLTA